MNTHDVIESGQFVNIFGSQTDISELKQDLAIKEEEQMFHAVFEHASYAIIGFTENNRIVSVNQTFLEVFGYPSASSIVGQIFFAVFAPEEKARMQEFSLQYVQVNAVSTHFETRGMRADGTIFDITVNIFRYELKGETYTLGIVLDLSECKRMKRLINGTLTELEHLKNQFKEESAYLQEEIRHEHDFHDIVGQSGSVKKLFKEIKQVARSSTTVMILGETGVGKELVARAIHEYSNRNHHPMIKVNCSALPPTLIENELFGHEKGAFTGATERQSGRFELADGGTLFLDEIGDFPLELQVKLLRVLQEKELERIGSAQTIKVDVRIIVATNRNLEQAMQEGRFRRDLFYRLQVFPVVCPTLRERKEDIPLLVKHFVEKFSHKTNKKVIRIAPQTMQILTEYHWPGNIRELENVIERAMIITTGEQLKIEDWFAGATRQRADECSDTLAEHEKKYICKILGLTNGRIRGKNGAAERLGLNPTTLESKMTRLGIMRS